MTPLAPALAQIIIELAEMAVFQIEVCVLETFPSAAGDERFP